MTKLQAATIRLVLNRGEGLSDLAHDGWWVKFEIFQVQENMSHSKHISLPCDLSSKGSPNRVYDLDFHTFVDLHLKGVYCSMDLNCSTYQSLLHCTAVCPCFIDGSLHFMKWSRMALILMRTAFVASPQRFQDMGATNVKHQKLIWIKYFTNLLYFAQHYKTTNMNK